MAQSEMAPAMWNVCEATLCVCVLPVCVRLCVYVYLCGMELFLLLLCVVRRGAANSEAAAAAAAAAAWETRLQLINLK